MAAARFEHLFFVCTHSRPAEGGKRSCGAEGDALLARMKAWVDEHKLKGRVRVVRSGCLDLCSRGCAVVALAAAAPAPQAWYTRLSPDDADALMAQHVDAEVLWAEHFER